MAIALIQCVTRTQSGWMVAPAAGAGSARTVWSWVASIAMVRSLQVLVYIVSRTGHLKRVPRRVERRHGQDTYSCRGMRLAVKRPLAHLSFRPTRETSARPG